MPFKVKVRRQSRSIKPPVGRRKSLVMIGIPTHIPIQIFPWPAAGKNLMGLGVALNLYIRSAASGMVPKLLMIAAWIIAQINIGKEICVWGICCWAVNIGRAMLGELCFIA